MSKAIEWWRQAREPTGSTERFTLRDIWCWLFGPIKTYVRISHDGASCIVSLGEGLEILRNSEPNAYEFKLVDMTEWEFERLPEFTGF